MLSNTSLFNVLAISASTSLCSVVLETPDQRYEWKTTDSNRHSEQLLPAVQQLLNQAGITSLKSNDFIAVDIGPGSFTSVRIACSIVQGLAFGWGCQVVAVESLTALVHQYLLHNTITTPVYIMAVIDARMNEYYAAQYYCDINVFLQQVAVPMLIPYEFKSLDIYQQSNILISNVVDIALNNVQVSSATHNKAIVQSSPLAIGVLIAAKIYIQQGLHFSYIDQLQPLYVRNQVALTTLERALIK